MELRSVPTCATSIVSVNCDVIGSYISHFTFSLIYKRLEIELSFLEDGYNTSYVISHAKGHDLIEDIGDFQIRDRG